MPRLARVVGRILCFGPTGSLAYTTEASWGGIARVASVLLGTGRLRVG
jgi:hypothetical protein